MNSSDAINSVDCLVNNSLIISGSMDGTAKLWNSTSGKCVGTLLCGAKVGFSSYIIILFKYAAV